MVFKLSSKLIIAHIAVALPAVFLPLGAAVSLALAITLIALAVGSDITKTSGFRARKRLNTSRLYGVFALWFVPISILCIRNPYGLDTTYATFVAFGAIAMYLFMANLSYNFYQQSEDDDS